MRNIIKNTLFLSLVVMLSSCAKEEFATNKGKQSSSTNSALSSSAKLCAQSTLISPKVDILMLWDNSTSFNIVNSETRASMGQLINSVSEKFDYHILSAPLISANSNPLFEAQLVVKNQVGLTSDAIAAIKSKDVAASSLSFTPSNSSQEPGVDRAIQMIEATRSKGIFRSDAYTIIVVISNEDDDSCETATGLRTCTAYDWKARMLEKSNKLLCLRGSVSPSRINCSGTTPLNSTMMRFINISPLTSCPAKVGTSAINYRYKEVASAVYNEPYTSGWPTSNDHISQDAPGYPDSYNLCTNTFSSIFKGVELSIQQTLIKHKYDYWPVAGATASIDPDSIRVVRTDGKILTNRAADPSASNGYELILDGSGKAQTLTGQNTRYSPAPGEPFTGKMIRLYGNEGNDKIVYPDCLTVTYSEEKLTYGYIYLTQGEPVADSIEIRLNGSIVPRNASNGWDYMGLQNTSALDSSLKVVFMPAGSPSGFIVRLNGSYKVKNTTSNNFEVFYTSKAN